MGPQPLLADIVRPVKPDFATIPTPRPKQNVGHFGDYLKDARSPSATSRPDPPDEPPAHDEVRSSDHQETKTKDNDPTQESDKVEKNNGESVVAVPTSDVGSVNIATNTKALLQTNGGSEPAAGDPSSSVTTQINTSDVPPSEEIGAQPTTPAPVKTANANDSAQQTQTSAPTGDSAQVPLNRFVDPNGENTTLPGAEPPLETIHAHRVPPDDIRLRNAPNGALNDKPVESATGQPTPRVLSQQQQADAPPAIVPGNAPQKNQRVDALSPRSDGLLADPVNTGKQTQVIGEQKKGHGSSNGNRPLRVADFTPASARKTVSLRGGHGDGAAASVARFLIGGSDGVSSPPVGSANGADGGRFHLSSVSGASGASSPTRLVGDLLAARIEGAGGIDRVAHVLTAKNGPGRYQVTMQLDPPDLGQLKVQIQMNHQGVSLHVDTQSKDVARLIESRMADLQDSLSSHGIHIQRTHVVVRTPESNSADPQSQGQSHSAQSGFGQGSAEGGGSGPTDSGQRQMTGEHAFGHQQDPGGDAIPADDSPGIQRSAGMRVEQDLPVREMSVDLVA